MFRFSHFNLINRSKTSKFLTLSFVISLSIHGAGQIATAVWILVTRYSTCALLQKYFVPVFAHLASGLSAELLTLSSFVSACCYNYKGHVRLFILGLGITIAIELTAILSAVVLDKMLETKFPFTMETNLAAAINSFNETGTDFSCWSSLQEQYQCCGATDFSDWCPQSQNKTNCDLENNALFDSCKCSSEEDKCVIFNNETIYKATCVDNVTEKLTEAFRLLIAMDAAFCIMQCMSYIAVNCILSKLTSKCAVGTYKPKPTESESRF